LKGNRQEVFGLIARIEKTDVRMEVLRKLFSEAKSIAWLTGIVHDALVEHGLLSKGHQPQENRLLSDGEFNLIRGLFLKRVSDARASDLLKTPYFLRLIYTWHHLGDAEEYLSWINKNTEDDWGFLEVLDNMRSWSHSTPGGVQYKLRPDTLDTFFDGVAGVQKRLDCIIQKENSPIDVKRRAEDMLTNFDDW
jgi:hypothetical protein